MRRHCRTFLLPRVSLPRTFKNTFNSFAVNVKVNNARQMTRRYAITGVPAIVVNGKYSTSVGMARGNEEVIRVMNYLIEKERK